MRTNLQYGILFLIISSTFAQDTFVPDTSPPPSASNIQATVDLRATAATYKIDKWSLGLTISTYGPGIVRDATWAAKLKQLGPLVYRIPLQYNNGNPVSSARGGDTHVTGSQWMSAIRANGGTPYVVIGGNVSDNSFTNADVKGIVSYFSNPANAGGAAVERYVIGNEPADKASYLNSLDGWLAAAKAANPSVKLSAPAEAYWNPGFIKPVMVNHSGVDIGSYHAYDGSAYFPKTSQYHDNILAMRSWRPGMTGYAVEEFNWMWKAADGFLDWRNTCFMSSVIGQILSAGGSAVMYSDGNGLLGLMCEGDATNGQPGVKYTTYPAYVALGLWTGMNGSWRRMSGSMVKTSSNVSDVDIFASSNGKIIAVNKGAVDRTITIALGGASAGTARVWRTSKASPYQIATRQADVAYSKSMLTVTLPAGTASSFDLVSQSSTTPPTTTPAPTTTKASTTAPATTKATSPAPTTTKSTTAPPATCATRLLYAETARAPEFEYWGWGNFSSKADTTRFHSGHVSASLFPCNYNAIFFHRNAAASSVSVAQYPKLTFWVYFVGAVPDVSLSVRKEGVDPNSLKSISMQSLVTAVNQWVQVTVDVATMFGLSMDYDGFWLGSGGAACPTSATPTVFLDDVYASCGRVVPATPLPTTTTVLTTLPQTTTPASTCARRLLYAETAATPEFESWGWGNYSLGKSTVRPHTGLVSASLYPCAFNAMYLHRNHATAPVSVVTYPKLTFWLYVVGTVPAVNFEVIKEGATTRTSVPLSSVVTAAVNQWVQVSVDVATLFGITDTYDGFRLQDSSGRVCPASASAVLFLDDAYAANCAPAARAEASAASADSSHTVSRGVVVGLVVVAAVVVAVTLLVILFVIHRRKTHNNSDTSYTLTADS